MELPRGMKDFEKSESSKIEYVRQKFIETCKIFGYELMEPSPIELLSVLEAKSGSSIKDEIYYFKDKGDREVALRFDFTVGLARYAAAQQSMKLPAKLASFGGVWRYDEPQKGRYRFFHQWDIEIFGKPSIEQDAEVLSFTYEFLRRLYQQPGEITDERQSIIIEISHRKIVESYINKIFGSNDPSLITDILRAMDKITKKPKDQILKEYQEKGYEKDKLEEILKFSEIKASYDWKTRSSAPEQIEKQLPVINELDGWDELKEIYELSSRMCSAGGNGGILNSDHDNQDIGINFGIVRGLDYYTGFVFEVFDTALDIGSLAGGGRYDSLPATFGRTDLGATGVAGGVERTILSLEEHSSDVLRNLFKPRISILYTSDALHHEALDLAASMRSDDTLVDVDLVGRSLKKQMESAKNSKFVIIIDSKITFNASENRQVVLRNMVDRTEKTMDIFDAWEELSKNGFDVPAHSEFDR